MRIRNAEPRSHDSQSLLTIHFKHEAEEVGNKSETETYILAPDDFAVMIDTDRIERAAQNGLPVDEVEPRHPQDILDQLWRDEESNAHAVHRGDRGKARPACTCGAGCGPRRGCRLPSTHPWSLDQMLEIGYGPTATGPTPEDALVAAEEARSHAADLAAMWTAIATLSDRHQILVELMVGQDMSQADVARYLGVSRARVSQLFGEVKTTVIEAVEQSRLNTPGVLGSGVKGPANGVGPQSEKDR